MAFSLAGLPKSMIESKLNSALDARKRSAQMEKSKRDKAEMVVGAAVGGYGTTFLAKSNADEETGKEWNIRGIPVRGAAAIGSTLYGVFGNGPMANRALGFGLGTIGAITGDMATKHVEESEDEEDLGP